MRNRNESAARGILLLLACGVLPQSVVYGQPGRHEEAISWDRNVGGIVKRYCIDCHSSDDPSGNINLEEDVNVRLIRNHRDKWMQVREVVRDGQMPPEDGEELPKKKRQELLAFIDHTLDSLDCTSALDPGPSVLRKLSRAEYDNAIEDLVGLRLNTSEAFPADTLAYGFENTGANASLSPVEATMYHDAARSIVKKIAELNDSKPRIYRRVFGDQTTERTREQTRQQLTKFAAAAFRKPTDQYYINRLLRIYDKAVDRGDDYETAIGHCLTAILISPNFLFRIEEDQVAHATANDEPSGSDTAAPVSDFELANRLSFLLWSRGPDQRLKKLAYSGQLKKPDVLASETRRMLRDDRAIALVENFFFKWLDFGQLVTHSPDPETFPEFTPDLRSAMQHEVRQTLRAIVAGDDSILAIVDSDHIFATPLLAEFYGLPTIEKASRMSVQDRKRGGLLTSAALLMLSADPNRTNIPRRGNFILGQILGTPPPPPPADVPELEVTEDDQEMTLREIFELHRSSPDCRGCHAKIDPIGFALENYDAIGRWRTEDRGNRIDPSGELPSGKTLGGVADLKDYLLSKQDLILRTLSRKLLIYSVGRGLVAEDECAVRAMVSAAKEGEMRLPDMVVALVQSRQFTHRRTLEP